MVLGAARAMWPSKIPATGVVLAQVPNGGAAEATAAVEAAERAQKPWAALTAKQRSALLRKWFELIVAARDDLALIMTSEQGKPLAEARGEIDYAASFIEFYAEEAKRVYGETIPRPGPTRASSPCASRSAWWRRSRRGISRRR